MLPSVVIVSPAGAESNNGNWRTAWRWRQLLAGHARARIVQRWPDADADQDQLMLALHARRSADAIRAWAQRHPARGLAVVLTGTDLYLDLQGDALVRRSIDVAQRLVVLQERGPDALPSSHRAKTRVVFQSTTARTPVAKSPRVLRAVMVGHLRAVKSPQTLYAAARLLRERADIRIDHIGAVSEAALGEAALATAAVCPSYRWLGPLPHALARQRIQRAHVLVHTSAAEGGAHVIMEAVRSGTPVLASEIPGNVGMLGASYDGYFAHGDSNALARLLERCRASQAETAGLLARLQTQCAARAALFDPERERAALVELLRELNPRA